jgi:hypothetical integral membrane protein (TIGR02206 family)
MSYSAFQVFGSQHLITLLICLIAIIGIPLLLRNKSNSTSILGAKITAGLMILHEVTQPFYDVYLFGLPWQGELPFHMCDMSAIAIIIFFLKDNAPKLLFNCAYFWGICGATMALLTPDLEFGFPHREYFPFFWGHSLLLLAIFYAMLVYKHRPQLADVHRVIGTTFMLLVIVFVINKIIGPPANYWYLAARPVEGTLLDYFPDPPFHLIGTIPLAITLFYIAYLPFLIKDLFSKKAASET